MFTGTLYKDIREVFTKSFYPHQPIPISLLGSESINVITQGYPDLIKSRADVAILGDVGGLPRALEIFIENFSKYDTTNEVIKGRYCFEIFFVRKKKKKKKQQTTHPFWQQFKLDIIGKAVQS